MERFSDKDKVIRAFNLRSRTSEFLPEVIPMLEADDNWEHIDRINDTPDGLQVFWQNGTERDERYGKLCLTLTRRALSLTIATDYKIKSQPNNVTRSTLVIEDSSYTALYISHRHSLAGLGTLEGEDAINRFRTDFDNTLIALNYKEELRLAS